MKCVATAEKWSNYTAFGSPMPGRSFNGNSYRRGFNGMEKDDEIKGGGNSYDFGARIYDSRLGKWMSVDPLQAKYAYLSPYNFTANNPIFYIDPDGRKIVVHYNDDNGKSHRVAIKKVTDIEKLKDAQGFGKDMYETLNYLKEDANLQLAINTKKAVHVREGLGAESLEFKAKETKTENGTLGEHQIIYEAHQATDLKDDNGNLTGEYQSPALGFLHEIGHFLNRIKNGARKHAENSDIKKNKDGSYVDPLYHSPEEKNVIKNVETPFAEKNGEPVRTNHKGAPGEYVESPTENSNSKKKE